MSNIHVWTVSQRKSPPEYAEGIFVAPFEQGKIGPGLFEAACLMGLERLVSKHRERAYRGGRCDHWIKVKNRAHPAFARRKDQF
jgi:bifunctional non-homologous end joining protein LigD